MNTTMVNTTENLLIALDIIKKSVLDLIHDQPLLASRLNKISRELEDVAKALEEIQ